MECLALHLRSNTETTLFEKVGCLFEKGKEGRESSLLGSRGLLGRTTHQEHRMAFTLGALLTPSRTSYRHRSCGALWSHPG